MKNYPPVIGVAGKMGSGKDSIASILVEHFRYVRHSMADPLRAECAEYLRTRTPPPGAPPDIVHIISGEEHWPQQAIYLKPTPHPIRRLLQWQGTEHRRAQNPDYWVDRMRETLAGVTTPVVIPDIRFENEVDMVRSLGGEVWIVSRRQADADRDPATHSHISERFCDEYHNWDLRIANDGTLEDLENTVKGIMRCISEKRGCQNWLAADRAELQGERLGASLGEIDWIREARIIARG